MNRPHHSRFADYLLVVTVPHRLGVDPSLATSHRPRRPGRFPSCCLPSASSCLPWLFQRGPARLRFTLRTGTAPLIVELGTYRGLLPVERWCRFCNSTAAIEDAEHFILHALPVLGAWANARQHLNDLVDDMLRPRPPASRPRKWGCFLFMWSIGSLHGYRRILFVRDFWPRLA